MGTKYTKTFEIIIDKKPSYPCSFVHHKIHLKIKLTSLKFGDHSILSTLQSLNTWLNINRFSTHREASIGFIKYISTGLTLQHIAKKRVSAALMNVDLTKKSLRTTCFTTITTNTNKMDN